MSTIDREALAAWLSTDRPPQLVAALSPWQFERGRIAGSRHFTSVDAALRTLERDRPVVVYCAGDPCPASRYAARLLRQHGFAHVVRFAGGLRDWDAVAADEPKTDRVAVEGAR